MAKKLTKKDFLAPASLTRRTLAYLVDSLILNFILLSPILKEIKNIVGENISFGASYEFFVNNPQKVSVVLVLGLVLVILTILYYSILEFKLRQTIGKMLFDIKVISKKANFKYSQTLIRNLSKPISILFIFDVLYLILKKQNQRFFEKISNTTVMREEIKI